MILKLCFAQTCLLDSEQQNRTIHKWIKKLLRCYGSWGFAQSLLTAWSDWLLGSPMFEGVDHKNHPDIQESVVPGLFLQCIPEPSALSWSWPRVISAASPSHFGLLEDLVCVQDLCWETWDLAPSPRPQHCWHIRGFSSCSVVIKVS